MKKHRALFTAITFLGSMSIWYIIGLLNFPVSEDNILLMPEWYTAFGILSIIALTVAVNILLKPKRSIEAEQQTKDDISDKNSSQASEEASISINDSASDETPRSSAEDVSENAAPSKPNFCKSCGTKIPDDAKFCPNCGGELYEASDDKHYISDFKEGVIHVYWADPEGHLLGKNKVFIDGVKVGGVKCGRTLDVTVSAGTHKISVYSLGDLHIEDTVEISASNPEEVFAYATVLNRFGYYERTLRVDRELPGPNFIPVPTCPTCGSTQVKKISGTGRLISVGTFGLASSSVGKSFYCKHCGYKW